MSRAELKRLLRAADAAIGPTLRDSPAARECLEALGAWLVAVAKQADDASSTSSARPADEQQPIREERSETSRPGEGEHHSGRTVSRGIVPLKIGDAVAHLHVEGGTAEIGRARQAADISDDEPAAQSASPADISLDLIVERCRLKAESCLVFTRRRAVEGDHEREREIVQQMNELIAQAKSLEDCFLWMFWRERTQPSDEVIAEIGKCYNALGDAAAFLSETETAPPETVTRADTESAFLALAHASAALRLAVEDTWLSTPDADQAEAHAWLLRETRSRRIYIPRYMSLDDPPERGSAESVVQHVAALRNEWTARRDAYDAIEREIKRIAYHASRATRSGGAPDEHDLARIAETLPKLDALGVRPTDKRLRDAVPERIARELPSDRSPFIAAFIAAYDQALATVGSQREPAAGPREWSGQVLEVRELLEARRIVIIGGEPRQDAIARMREAFALREVDWISLREHASAEPMRAPIARDDTALVVVIVKLAGHLHVDEARRCATRNNRPLVMLTGGYNPEQIAEAVLAQASERLTAG